ncbi:hypothetical protein HK098_004360 [Nowakowskiella sp. JEL0407]|nr:hypothetical protein HK098_004360 [Nowakowskiella sp. JEL0407]
MITVSGEVNPELTYKTLLLIDASGSLQEYWSDLINGVQSLIKYLQTSSSTSYNTPINLAKHEVAVALFHGTEPFDLRLNFTSDFQLATKLLQSISPYQYASTPLYAGLNSSLNFLDATIRNIKAKDITNLDGAESDEISRIVTTLVLFSDGMDQSQPLESVQKELTMRIQSSRHHSFVIQTKGEENFSERDFASNPNWYFPVTQDVSSISLAFSQVAASIGTNTTGRYTIRYCSPRALSNNTFMVSLSSLPTKDIINNTYSSNLLINQESCFLALTNPNFIPTSSLYSTSSPALTASNQTVNAIGGQDTSSSFYPCVPIQPAEYSPLDPILSGLGLNSTFNNSTQIHGLSTYLVGGAVTAVVLGVIIGLICVGIGGKLVYGHAIKFKGNPSIAKCGGLTILFGIALILGFGIGFSVPKEFWVADRNE